MATPATSKGRARARCRRRGHLADGAAVGHDGQDGELVAAEAGQDVVAAQQLAQARGDVDEQAVALLVAHRVVDLLEAVEVDEHEARRGSRRGRRRQRPGAVLVQLGAVGQAGERVVRRLVAQAARGARDDAKQAGPQEQQASDERDEQRAGVRRDGAGGRLVGHVALEDAAADRHVDLEEAALGAELVGVGLDVGVDLARERRADVAVTRRVLADELVVVGPGDVPAVVVELAAQQAARGEPPVERGDRARARAGRCRARRRAAGRRCRRGRWSRPGAGCPGGRGARCGLCRSVPRVAPMAMMTSRLTTPNVCSRLRRGRRIRMGTAVGAPRLGLEARAHDADACAARAPGRARTARNAGSLGRRTRVAP